MYHQGTTESGAKVHAVKHYGRRSYAPRALCGVRIAEAKQRLFSEGCNRCKGSLPQK